MHITVLICTHNRAGLLGNVLDSLNAAEHPVDCRIDVLVVANACTDDTAALLEARVAAGKSNNGLPLRWVHELTPGKSNALNRAIPMLDADLVAFVDDDHRVDIGYLSGVHRAALAYPEATLFCGRILPDWNGNEPPWVHDTGPFRIYPLPVPHSDRGPVPESVTLPGPLPGGGNLVLRRAVFARVGGFSADLGPRGHDLGGGEDSEFVTRCLSHGERLQYVPWFTQFHYVDPTRLHLGYLLRKGYQRSRSGMRVRAGARSAILPLFMWRKLISYCALGLLSGSWQGMRFYLVRLAAVLGEMRGSLDGPGTSGDAAKSINAGTSHLSRRGAWLLIPMLASMAFIIGTSPHRDAALLAIFVVPLLCTAILLVKSMYDFSQTGPQLKREVMRNYRTYSTFAILRLAGWMFALCAFMACSGILVYLAIAEPLHAKPQIGLALLAASAGVALITARQFCRQLLFLPASIAISYNYRQSRLYGLWRMLSARRLAAIDRVSAIAFLASLATSSWLLFAKGQTDRGAAFLLLTAIGLLWASALSAHREPRPTTGRIHRSPNIVMIGSDTLRADRLGAMKYRRNLTPFIDSLAARGCQFTECYVPCARTAPSLISMLTGTWPCRHGIRDNFVGDSDTMLDTPALAAILADHGYRTAAVSDWCGADLAKFHLGFEIRDLPDDQWNIKYLLRQGPKDLRLFLSLFTHSDFGKRFLPELYYLAGLPLTQLAGRDARTLIGQLAAGDRPFFLNVFLSTTHPPFGSEYPYYTMWPTADYSGESKFVMARLTDPWEIIRRQGDTKKEFDLDQIVDLYDGCVRNFDDEVKRIVDHVSSCGIADNTIFLIYSDHGMEFFEHDTWGQGNSVHGDFSARVPLVIVDPSSGGSGVRSEVVRTIDIAPTLLALVGIAPPKAMDGVSLVPYLRDVKSDMNLAAFNETGIWLTDLPGMPVGHLRYPDLFELLEVPDKRTGTLAIKPEYRRIIEVAKDRMVRAGGWKLTYQPTHDGPIYALFDINKDPECKHDVAAIHPEITSEMRDLLTAWMTCGAQEPVRQGERDVQAKGLPPDEALIAHRGIERT